ncbi:MAG: Ig domain-containing protein, partial [Vicinamibacterales bacterium]
STPVKAVPVAITTTSLPAGRVGSSYSGQLLASGGSGAYSWTVMAGTLPAGITLDASTGFLSGTPLTAGSFTFSIGAADAPDAMNRATASYTIPIALVSLPVAITTGTLPGGRESTPYSAALVASGGSGAFRWSVTEGTLPPGVVLNAATGVLSGTPTNAGTTGFTITAADAGDALNVTARAYTVTMSAAVKIYASRSLPMAAKGVPYTHTVASSNVQGMSVWDVASGKLPPGMLLNAAVGSISGTCLTAGKWTFNLRVKDASTNDSITLMLLVK